MAPNSPLTPQFKVAAITSSDLACVSHLIRNTCIYTEPGMTPRNLLRFIKSKSRIWKLSAYLPTQWAPLLHEPPWDSSFPSSPRLSSCFLVYSPHIGISGHAPPYSHATFWEQRVTPSAEPFTAHCAYVRCWRSISSFHKEKPIYFSRLFMAHG